MALAATVFGPCQSEISAQHPQQHAIAIHGQGRLLAIQLELELLLHDQVLSKQNTTVFMWGVHIPTAREIIGTAVR